VRRSTVSERALILAPRGRDAKIAATILRETGFAAEPCLALPDLIVQLDAGTAFVVVTEEALATANLSSLATWLDDQEEWSDLPFVLLTTGGGGLERNPAARRYLDVLGNVAFLERPFHPTVLGPANDLFVFSQLVDCDHNSSRRGVMYHVPNARDAMEGAAGDVVVKPSRLVIDVNKTVLLPRDDSDGYLQFSVVPLRRECVRYHEGRFFRAGADLRRTKSHLLREFLELFRDWGWPKNLAG